VELLIVGIARWQFLASLGHALGLGMSFAFVLAYDQLWLRGDRHENRVGLLVVVAASSLFYFGVDVWIRSFGIARRGEGLRRMVESMPIALSVVAVLASTAGLIVLVLPVMGWATFVVMFIPVLATR